MGGLIDDPLVSFFFYSVFVFPACGWILKPGRFPKRTALWYAIGFLATIAALKTGLEVNERGPNHYQVLDVARTSNPLEIKRAYKRLSLELHPDKNPSPEAADLCVRRRALLLLCCRRRSCSARRRLTPPSLPSPSGT